MNSKAIILISGYVIFTTLLIFSNGCKKDNEPNNTDDKVEEKVQEVSELQIKGNEHLTSLLLTQDTTTALNNLESWFEQDPSVEWAESGDQGVMILYKNGLRGGIFINGMDEPILKSGSSQPTNTAGIQHPLKYVPNKKSIWFLNPHNEEREIFFNEILAVYIQDHKKVMKSMFYEIGPLCTLDRFANLDDCSYIHIYSHGIAWPNNEWVDEVYLMTGDDVTPEKTRKYKELVESGDILCVFDRISEFNLYCVSPNFITHYNDFSKDTVLFYGGFCYSFMGRWPQITSSFARGAYFGFTSSVRTNWNARWSQYLFREMADTLKENPVTVEDWMNGTSIPKEYYDTELSKTVKIQYSGNADMALWQKQTRITLSIEATDFNGAPLSTAGWVNKPYGFMCNVTGANFNELHYKWDKGDGSTPIETTYPQVEFTWNDPGTYTLKVEAFLNSNNQKVAEKTVQVNLTSHVYLNSYNSQNIVSSNDYSLNFDIQIGNPLEVFRLRVDTLRNVYSLPEYNYKHELSFWEKKFDQGETRTYTVTISLSNLTTSLQGTPSFKKVWVQIWDKTGDHYYEFDGLSPITLNVVTDETHLGSLTTNAWLTTNGSEDTLFPLDLIFMKEQ